MSEEKTEQNEQKIEGKTEEEIREDIFDSSEIESFELNPYIYSALKKMKITQFTQIQAQSIPQIINGNDVLMRADTGSGKTLAYLLPIFHRLAIDFPKATNPINRKMGCLCIVIAPTRELCLQIDTVVQELRSQMPFVVSGTLLGGEKVQSEKKRIRKGINLLIGTPGRLEYHLENSQNLFVDNLKFLVLDEADRLLDMGFGKKVAAIIEKLPQRQTILVSATLHKDLFKLADISLTNPVNVGEMKDEEFSIPITLLQRFVTIDAKWRLASLCALLSRYFPKKLKLPGGDTYGTRKPIGKAIVFLSCCKSVDFHYAFFSHFDFYTPEMRRINHIPQRNYKGPSIKDKEAAAAAAAGLTDEQKAEAKITIRDIHASTDNDEVGSWSPFLECEVFRIHGNVDQIERSKTMAKFTAAEHAVLFCTDVAARGLDIPDVALIVQYDPPVDTEDYVHRVGRTARIGHDGISFLFLQERELGFIDLLHDRHVQIKEYKNLIEKAVEEMKGDRTDTCMAALRAETISTVKENDLDLLAAQAWAASIAAYTSHHKSTRGIFRSQELHLGHYATAFGLDKAPAQLKEMIREDRDLQEKINKPPEERKELLPAFEERTSEFL